MLNLYGLRYKNNIAKVWFDIEKGCFYFCRMMCPCFLGVATDSKEREIGDRRDICRKTWDGCDGRLFVCIFDFYDVSVSADIYIIL